MEIHSAFFVPQAATAANFRKTKKEARKLHFFFPVQMILCNQKVIS